MENEEQAIHHPFRLNYFCFFDRYWVLFEKYYARGKAKCAAELVHAIGEYLFEGKEPEKFSSKEVENDWLIFVEPIIRKSLSAALRQQKHRQKNVTDSVTVTQ